MCVSSSFFGRPLSLSLSLLVREEQEEEVIRESASLCERGGRYGV